MEPITPNWLDMPEEPDNHDRRTREELVILLRQANQREVRLRKRIKFFEQERNLQVIKARQRNATTRVRALARKLKPSPIERTA